MTEGQWGKRVKRSLLWRIESTKWRVQESAALEVEVRRVRSGNPGDTPPVRRVSKHPSPKTDLV
jgi:hypothetical protein